LIIPVKEVFEYPPNGEAATEIQVCHAEVAFQSSTLPRQAASQ
jgi:hypothetical protein